MDRTEELTNQIYDTLMQNVGMSEHHTSFPIDELLDFEVDARKGEMFFTLGKVTYRVTVTAVYRGEP